MFNDGAVQTVAVAAPRAAWVWLWEGKLSTATDHVAGNAAVQRPCPAVGWRDHRAFLRPEIAA
ncbi:MAG: hypothetical protein B7W99_02985 [Rhodospirillales bacterium 20-58-10]|nr:MAG: hypothetical protein B7W99_02985 [Rhodospirillales bacterium 20-58-10]